MKFSDYFKLFSERAYHGSAKKIKGTFCYSKIGSGQGAQSFGYGFYFTTSKTIAAGYVANSYKKSYRYKGKEAIFWYDFFVDKHDYVKAEIWENIMLHHSRRRIKINLEESDATEDDFKYLKSLPSQLFAPEAGSLYEVEINASKDELLKWDASVEDQSEFIKNKLKTIENVVLKGSENLALFNKQHFSSVEEMTGMQVYYSLINTLYDTPFSELTNEAHRASMFLNSIGIKGIKYPANDGKEENYVIFDPKNIENLKQIS